MALVHFQLVFCYLLFVNKSVENLKILGDTGEKSTIFENYLREILKVYDIKSLIAIYNNNRLFAEYSKNLYKLQQPVFDLHLARLGDFNRNYERGVVIEESKINVIFIGDLQEFPRILHLSRQIHFWKDRDKIVVIVDNYQQSDYLQLQNNFKECFNYYIINIIFVIPSFSTDGFTYNPFLNNYTVIATTTDPYPDKLLNLHRYQLKVSMFDNIMDSAFDGRNYIGRDGTASRTILERLNATFIYHQTLETETLPLVDVQLYEVGNRTVDLGFNTRYVKTMFANLVEGTYPHDSDDLVGLVPVLRSTSNASILSLLPLIGWFETLTGVVLFIGSVIILAKINKQYCDLSKLIVTALIVFLGISAKSMRINNYRIVLYFYVFFSFITNTLIISKLTSMLTAPAGVEQINTVEQLAETNYKISTLARYKVMLDDFLPEQQHRRILPRVNIVEERYQINEIRQCNGIVHICKNHIAQYSIVQKTNYPNQTKYYRIMKEPIMPSINCYIVTFGSPFQPRLSRLVRRTVEAGLMDYWKRTNWHRLFLKSVGFSSNTKQVKSLSLIALKSGFYPLLIGLLLSILVFLYEILIGYIKNSSNGNKLIVIDTV